MYEIVAVPFNNQYGKEKAADPRKVIFTNTSREHLTITVVDPAAGVSAEATIRKDTLPAFVADHDTETD